MRIQSYIDMLNRSELVKTWQASGASALVLATITFAILSATGSVEWVGSITLAVAGLSGAMAKFAAELKRLGEGRELPPQAGK